MFRKQEERDAPYAPSQGQRKYGERQVTIGQSELVLDISQPITCRHRYCLYILTCTKPGCGQQYCGLSYRPLFLRFADHLVDTQDSSSSSAVGSTGRSQDTASSTYSYCRVKLGTRDSKRKTS